MVTSGSVLSESSRAGCTPIPLAQFTQLAACVVQTNGCARRRPAFHAPRPPQTAAAHLAVAPARPPSCHRCHAPTNPRRPPPSCRAAAKWRPFSIGHCWQPLLSGHSVGGNGLRGLRSGRLRGDGLQIPDDLLKLVDVPRQEVACGRAGGRIGKLRTVWFRSTAYHTSSGCMHVNHSEDAGSACAAPGNCQQ